MQQIKTSLMFVGEQAGKAEEAIDLYVSLFDDSRLIAVEHYGDNEGETGVKQARFLLAGREFPAMDSAAAHQFTFTPSVSLTAEFDDESQIDSVVAALGEGGTFLMPLGDYGFSRRFAWLNDRFGVSRQLNLVADG